ncbi:MAG: hypothetical protein LAN62_12630, partial [Acidobacteriia bacterium]|nr:hypothetical protein [Terriglobia bacterium]
VAKVTTGGTQETWWAGATVSEEATQKGIPIFPERGNGGAGFFDREMKYAKRWLASMGIYEYEEAHDPWYSEMVNFLASVRERKLVVAPFEIGVGDALGVIYGNRSVDTGQKVFWPR